MLIRVHATACNRADTLQRKGLYPAPPGSSPIIGLEAAGEVVSVGSDVKEWKAGDRVMALLPGLQPHSLPGPLCALIDASGGCCLF
jgi:NADPH:quinone reductase-like Zn-dependent oxidoreductase